jgi:hypothetical protein
MTFKRSAQLMAGKEKKSKMRVNTRMIPGGRNSSPSPLFTPSPLVMSKGEKKKQRSPPRLYRADGKGFIDQGMTFPTRSTTAIEVRMKEEGGVTRIIDRVNERPLQ